VPPSWTRLEEIIRTTCLGSVHALPDSCNPGAQFTCFTGTEVQILTTCLGIVHASLIPVIQVLSLLALLVQKYKY